MNAESFIEDSYFTYPFLSVLISQVTYTIKVVFTFVITGAKRKILQQKSV